MVFHLCDLLTVQWRDNKQDVRYATHLEASSIVSEVGGSLQGVLQVLLARCDGSQFTQTKIDWEKRDEKGRC